MRGPSVTPALIALRSPMSTKSLAPTLRTVVNPAPSVRFAYSAAYRACSAGKRITQIDDPRSGGRRPCPHRHDPIAPDDHSGAVLERRTGRVEQMRSLEHDG